MAGGNLVMVFSSFLSEKASLFILIEYVVKELAREKPDSKEKEVEVSVRQSKEYRREESRLFQVPVFFLL